MMRLFSKVFLCSVLLAIPCYAQDLASFEKKMTVKKLDNGLTVLIYPRNEAPVFSFFTLVDAGSVQDPLGSSGLAHMFEHMAFKGTANIGTTNFPAERAALEKVEQAYAAYDAERRKEVGRDEQKVAELKQAFEDRVKDADQYVDRNAFGRIVEQEGGVGLNAYTSMDETGYMYSLPSNRVELWAYLESERMLHPVFREFYKEREVVYEERRMRVDSSPIGRLVEQFLAAAYTAHPYQRSGVGWPSEVCCFSATEAANFYKIHYVPSNMVIALVGDLNSQEVMPIVEKYFRRLSQAPVPEDIRTVEPQQFAERDVIIKEKSQPTYLEGYHRPSYRDPDDNVYDVISDLLSEGRTSRLYRSLVRDKKIAAVAAGFSGFPGNKYPNMFAFYVVPIPGHTAQEMAPAVRAEIERLKNEDVSDDELRMVKTRFKANLIRSLDENEGLAQNLALYQTRYGDWRELFKQIDKIEKVTKADIRRVANKTFLESNRTVAVIENQAPAKSAQNTPSEKGAN